MTIKEPKNQIKIQPTDIVSGRLYLKLIEDYKEYDKQQKEYIHDLECKIISLSKALRRGTIDSNAQSTINESMTGIENNYALMLDKERQQQEYIKELLCQISDLSEALSEIATKNTFKKLEKIHNQRLTLRRQKDLINSLMQENKELKQIIESQRKL